MRPHLPRLRPLTGCGALLAALCVADFSPAVAADQTNRAPAAAAAAEGVQPPLPTRPLSLAECVDIALQQNAAVAKSRSDLEAAYGLAVQTRAILLPRLQGAGQYGFNEQTESLAIADRSVTFQREQSWNGGLRVVQSIYEGGRIQAARKTARLTREQALLQHQAVILDAMLLVKLAYYDALLAEQLIRVEEASIQLLQRELDDTTRRYNAGTVPRFNVLRSEVEVAGGKPRLFQARNAFRIAKNHLCQLLGYRVPPEVWEDIPLNLSGKLEAEPFQIELPAALQEALAARPELRLLRASQSLQRENVKSAKAGYLPSVQVFGGYGWRSSSFQQDLSFTVDGWNAGAQVTWNLFDGLLTKGKVQEAEALLQRAGTEIDDQTRRIEMDVRVSYSSFVEAREILESQKKVVEQAEEALRLAVAREQAGAVTQLDVLDAQTSLTQARTTQIRALRDYEAARARLDRALGRGLPGRPE